MHAYTYFYVGCILFPTSTLQGLETPREALRNSVLRVTVRNKKGGTKLEIIYLSFG